jgi:uncharacterized protein (DUF1330 family)
MKAKSIIASIIALCVASFVFGALAVEGLHAQAKPPAYVIVEATLTDVDGYVKEFIPPAAKAISEGGGKYLARGGTTISFVGSPPSARFVLLQFESLDKAQAWWDSPGRKDAQAIGDKFALFRIFAAEGLSP